MSIRKNRLSKFSSLFLWRCALITIITICSILLYLNITDKGNIKDSTSDSTKRNYEVSKKLTQEECKRSCLSRDCIKTASKILEHVQMEINPCDNFYSFACGKWTAKFTKEENYSVLDEMKETMKVVLKNLISEIEDPADSNYGKVKTLYDSCVSFNSSEINAKSSILQFLRKLGLQDWPNLNLDFRFADPRFEEVITILASYLETSFVSFIIRQPEDMDSSNHMINLTITYDLHLLRDENEIHIFETRIRKILNYFDVAVERSDEIWEEFQSFDKKIQKNSEDHDCNEDCEEKVFLLDCSSQTNDSLIFMCNILEHVIRFNEFEKNGFIDQVMFENYNLMLGLHYFLTNSSQRSLANYLVLRLFLNHLDDLNAYFRSIPLTGGKTSSDSLIIFNQESSRLRWKDCIGWLMNNIPYPLAQIYFSKKFSAKQLKYVTRTVETVANASARYILSQNWISEDLRLQLASMLENTKNSLEKYVKETFDPKLNILLQKFQPRKESFFENVMEHRKNMFGLRILHGSEIRNSEFPIDMFEAQVYHDFGYIDFRLGFLLPPILQLGRPFVMNLATLGFIVGHEIGHEINFYFRDLESDNSTTYQNYLKKKSCLEQQYSNYILEKINKSEDSEKTYAENFADLVSIQLMDKIIDQVYHRALKLPGIAFTSKQLFYISQAQIWCSVKSKELEQYNYEKDEHAAYYLRVYGMMQNSRGFANAFNCSKKSFMNPEKKCSFFE